MTQKCKINTSFDALNQFFSKLALSLRVWKVGKKSETKNSPFKKKKSLFKTQVISFLNLRHNIESGGVSVMLNLVFYVFKGNQLKFKVNSVVNFNSPNIFN